jgi:hypothetical protein
MSPCMILGPMSLFRTTCKKFLIFNKFFFKPHSDSERAVLILDTSRVFWIFSKMMAQFTIFSRLSTRAHMLVLIAYSDPLRKDEISEYKFKGIWMDFYF